MKLGQGIEIWDASEKIAGTRRDESENCYDEAVKWRYKVKNKTRLDQEDLEKHLWSKENAEWNKESTPSVASKNSRREKMCDC